MIYLIAVLGALVLFMGGGVYVSKHVQDVDDFYIMGQNAPWWMIMGTVMATWFSLWTFMGGFGMTAGLGFLSNPLLWAGLSTPAGICILMLIYGPPLRRAGVRTLPEYFEKFFGTGRMRAISAAVVILALVFYITGQTIGGAIIFDVVLGIPYWVGALIFFALVVPYVMAGGMWSVITMDTIMWFIMLFFGIVTLPLVLIWEGGFNTLVHSTYQVAPYVWDEFKLSSMWTWSYGLAWVAIGSVSPHLVNRVFAAKSEKAIIKGAVAGLIFSMVVVTGFYVAAPAGLLHFNLANLGSVDYLWPLMCLKVFPTWFGAPMLAAMMLAAAATTNSILITQGTAIGGDIYKRFVNKEASQSRVINMTRIGVLAFATIALLLTIMRPDWITIVTAFTGVVLAAGMFWMFALSLMAPRLDWVTETQAFWTLLLSMPIGVGIVITDQMWAWTGNIFVALPALIAGGIIFLILGLVTGDKTEEEKKSLKDFLPQLWPSKPESIDVELKDYLHVIVLLIFGLIWMIWLFTSFLGVA